MKMSSKEKLLNMLREMESINSNSDFLKIAGRPLFVEGIADGYHILNFVPDEIDRAVPIMLSRLRMMRSIVITTDDGTE